MNTGDDAIDVFNTKQGKQRDSKGKETAKMQSTDEEKEDEGIISERSLTQDEDMTFLVSAIEATKTKKKRKKKVKEDHKH